MEEMHLQILVSANSSGRSRGSNASNNGKDFC